MKPDPVAVLHAEMEEEKPKERGGRPQINLTDEQIASALRACHGLLNPTAKVLGIDVSCLRRKMKPQHIAIAAEMREVITDVAEQNLFQAIMRGDPKATEYWLKYQGKARGYCEKQEVKLEGGVSLQETSERRKAIAGLLSGLTGKVARTDGPK